MAEPGRPQGLSPSYGSIISPNIPSSLELEWEYRTDGTTGDVQSKARVYFYKVSYLEDEPIYEFIKQYDLIGSGDRVNAGDMGIAWDMEQEYAFRVRTTSKAGVSSELSRYAHFIYAQVAQSSSLSFSDRHKDGDTVTRETYFDEIKIAMVELLEDYVGSGNEDEDYFIDLSQQLFSGMIVPSKEDFLNMKRVLKHISTVKETGSEYAALVSSINDGLGVRDLQAIISYLQGLQSLPPKMPGTSLATGQADMYAIEGIGVEYEDDRKLALLVTWSTGSIDPADGLVRVTPSDSEDVSYYEVRIGMGLTGASTLNVMYYRPEDLSALEWRIPFDIPWNEIFKSTNIDKAFVEVKVRAIDKRGNVSEYAVQRNTRSATQKTPLGVSSYELEYKLNSGSWIALAKPTEEEYIHRLKPGTGNMYYRVRAKDKAPDLYSAWKEKGPVKFSSPYPPAAPAPTVSTSVTTAVLSWKEAQYADYYQVWIGDEATAKRNKKWYVVDDTTKTGETFKKTFTGLSANTTYNFTVRAVNVAGSKSKQVSGKTKLPSPKTKVYDTKGLSANWHTAYTVNPANGNKYTVEKGWHNNYREDCVIQGEWREGYTGWHSGGSYWARVNQKWGRHKGCWFLPYNQIKSDMKDKRISKVTLRAKRSSSIHGFKEDAVPVYLWLHDETYKPKPNDPEPRLWDKRTFNAKIDRGQNFVLSGKDMLSLFQKIVNGEAKGLAIYKDYGGSETPQCDHAYMVLDDNMKIEVEYYDE